MLIFHHTNQLGIGGTEKTAGIYIKNQRRLGYDARFITKRKSDHTRKEWCKKNNIPVHYYDNNQEYREIVKDADIVHFHRGGWQESPCIRMLHSNKTALVETNIFGHTDLSGSLDASFYLTEETKPNFGYHIPQYQLPNPIELPYTAEQLPDANNKRLTLGKFQRADDNIFLPEPHMAIHLLELPKKMEFEYWVVNPNPKLIKMGLNHHRFLDPITDDIETSKFYNTINILVSSRTDGETFGCNILEAAMHGTPSIIHRSHKYNAHLGLFQGNLLAEWIVDEPKSLDAWNDKILWATQQLWSNPHYWVAHFQALAVKFEAEMLTVKLMSQYKEILSQKLCLT